MKTLGERWAICWNVLADPGVFFMTLSTAGLIILSLKQKDGGVSAAVTYVLITLAAAILGGRAWQQWQQATEEGALNVRGNLSVRNLSLLLQSISSLNVRLKSFLKRDDHIKNNPDVTIRNYEEAINGCTLLLEQTISAIESWTDIVPGADMKTQIGMVTDLTTKVRDTEDEISRTKAALAAEHGQQSAERNRLAHKVEDLQKQVDAQKHQLYVANTTLPFGSVGMPLSELLNQSAARSIASSFEGGTLTFETPDSDIKI
jgi:hypothetical protein